MPKWKPTRLNPAVETTSERIDRHLNGERVTSEYIDLKTRETIRVSADEEPPSNCVPLLGEVT